MNIELAILTVLAGAPRAVNAAVIAGFMGGLIGRDATITDIGNACRSLETKGHAKGTHDEDRGTLWAITPDGRLRIG